MRLVLDGLVNAGIGKALESEMAHKNAHLIAGIEAQQLDIAIRQAEAVGLDAPTREWSVEQRATVWLDIARAKASGTFGELWAEEIGAEEFDSTPQAEWVGAGTDSEVWQEQLDDWAAEIRRLHPDVEATDRELASVACNDTYGIPLEKMEEIVVEMDVEQEIRRLLTANFSTAQDLQLQVTEAIEESDVEVADG